MNLQQIMDRLNLTVLTELQDFAGIVPTGGYSSDLLSCVMAGARKGHLWITLQAHLNVVAVAALNEVAAIIITENAQPDAKRLTALLLERHRLSSAPEIYQQFQSLLLQEKGIVVADVTTALPLDDTAQQMIQKQLSQLVGKDVELRTQVDPAIIGGMVARIGDNLIDGSVSNQLRRLHERLTTSNV